MRIHLIPNAWRASSATMSRAEAREVLGLPTDRPVVGWVGRLSAEKGPDVFVEALARTVDRRTIGCLVGDGRERADVERLGDSLGLGDRLRLPGLIADAARLYAAFDLFVLSSRTEGTPISLFQAMAARVPVVATAVGGVPDVVSADDALLVPPNAAAALARAIDASLGDPAAAADRASRAAARLVRDFGVDPWLDRYDALYASLARSPS
jgi:glycosyltransferase involved in cell wall biosynthesis